MEQEKELVVNEEMISGTSDELTVDKARRLFHQRDRFNAINKLRDGLLTERRGFIGDDNVADKIEEMIAGMTPEQLKELPDEAINQIFIVDDKPVIFDGIEFRTPEDEMVMKRDLIVFLKENEIFNRQIDKDLRELEMFMDENKKELDNLISEFGSLSAYMRSELVKKIDTAEYPEKRKKLCSILEAFDDSLTLDRLYDNLKSINLKNVMTDYHNRSESVYKRYTAVLKELDVTTDLTNFEKLEEKFLEEKYQKYPNLFLFAVIRYFSYKKGKAIKSTDGIFLSQLSVNVQSLFAESFETEKKCEDFKNSIRRVLDLFI